jgi:hypothetical protein
MKTRTASQFALLAFFACASTFTLASEPSSPEAAKLKQAYERAVEEATAPLRERYVAELKQLLERTMDEALALRAEIASVPSSATELGNRLIGTNWNWNNEYPFVLQFQAGGKGSGSDGTIKWKVVNPLQLEYTFRNGNHGTIDFEHDLTKAAVSETYPNGQKVVFPLLRIKK